MYGDYLQLLYGMVPMLQRRPFDLYCNIEMLVLCVHQINERSLANMCRALLKRCDVGRDSSLVARFKDVYLCVKPICDLA